MAVKEQIALQRARLVIVGIDLAASRLVVRQLHHVVKIIFPAAYVEDVDLAVVRAGDGLEFQDAFELSLERPIVVERAAPNDFDRAKRAGDAAGGPASAGVTYAVYCLREAFILTGTLLPK